MESVIAILGEENTRMELSGQKREPKGQALVEFALILIVLLGFIFIIIESGRLFQGWLTVQNSARSAGRYALTGQFDPTCLDNFPPCLDPRVVSIKKEARKAAAGLAIFADAIVGDPNSFITEVWSQDRDTGIWRPDDAGEAGEAVRIRVTYNLPIVVPLFEPIVDTVRLRGQVVVNNEDFDQISDNDTYSAAPSIGLGGDYEELPIADVRITKDTIADEFLLGESLDYYIDIYNDGPFDAEGIIVTDALPNIPGFIYTGFTLAPEDGFCTDPISWTPGTPVNCQLRNLTNDPPLNHVQLILSAQTPYSLSGSDSETLDNNVTVESDQSVTIDPDLSNNQALKQVILRKPNADIGISLIDTPDPTLANRPLNYVATVTNDGPDPTGTITATLNIDPQIDELSISFTDPNCSQVSAHTIECVIPLGLAAGGIYQFTVDVTTPSILVTDPTFLVSEATVESDIIESVDVLPNTDTAMTTVAGKLGDVYIAKVSDPTRISLGDPPPEISYIITVGQRTGPDLDSASSITVTDTLPLDMIFISDTGSYCNNNIDPRTVVCSIPPADIPADPGTLQFEIIVRPDETGTFDNFVRIDSNLEDATPQDNTDTAQTIVGANDLAITKSATKNIFIGEPFTYTLTVENLGPRDLLEGFTVSDTLPDGVTVIGTNGPDGPSNCSPNGGSEESIVAWCLDEILVDGQPLVFDITAKSSVDGEIVNTASVYPSSVNEPDPFPANNEDSLTSVVQRKVDLVLDKSEVVDPVMAGGQISYTLQVWNLGPSFASEVTIVDNLPSVLTFDPTNSSAGCSVIGLSVTCILDDILPVGITETLTIVANVDSALNSGDTIQNTAVVSSFEVELVPENNTDTEITNVSQAVDLHLTKSDSPDPVAAGAGLNYTLVVENNGPSDASNVTISDELPAVLRFDPVGSSNNCEAIGQQVTCNSFNLAANETQSFNISSIVTSTLPAGATIQNTAIVTSTEQEINPGDNSASATTSVSRKVDVQILKLDDPDPVVAGTVLTYTFRVRNNGPSDAFGVRFVDELPKWMTINSINAPDPVTCTSKKTNVLTLECDIGDMSAAEVVIVNVQFLIPPDRQHNSTLLNTAEVFITGPDENPANNISPEQVTTIVRDADLRIQKNASTNTIFAGEILEFSINVWNDGPSYADGVVISDILANGLIFAGSPDGCSAVGQSVSCPVGNLQDGASDLARFSVDVDSALPPSTITNTATVTSTIDPDSNLSNNTSNVVQISTDVEADLSITKDDGISTIVAGENTIFTYQIEVTNDGPSDARSIVVTDTWPSEYTLESITISSGSCAIGGPGFNCTPEDIKPGNSVVIAADYTVPANTPASSVTNQVEVSSETPDPSSPNIATDTNNVVIEADLSITKNDGESIVVAGDGQTYQYSMTIGNAGPSDAIDVQVTDNWPTGLDRGAINAPAGVSCTDNAAGFTCTNINLLVGESTTINVDYSVPASTLPGDQTNSAQVSLVGNSDPDNSNNQATDTTTVETWVDLSITKDDGINTAITAGENVTHTFTISAANIGPSDANEVMITDVWPADYEIVNIPAFCTGPDINDEINCTLGGLISGAEPITFTIDYRVIPVATLGTTTNSVDISSNDTTELNSADNSDTDANEVIGSADLAISKDDGVTTPIVAGDGITFTYAIVVTNNGPSNAGSFSVDDTWPIEFSQGSVNSSAGTCMLTGGDFSCDFGGLLPNETVTINAEFTIPANTAPGTYTNTAAISDPTTPDPDVSNDSATVGTGIDVSADLAITKVDDVLGPVTAGDGNTYIYNIEVTNNGPSDAGAFSVSDVWPTDFIQGSVTSADGNCTANSGDFSCDFSGLGSNESVSITAEFSVPSNVSAGAYSNTASISNVSTPDSDGTNDSAAVDTDIINSVDLSINKSDGVSIVITGTNTIYTYTITASNTGPSDAENVTIEEAWPADLVRNSILSTDGICSPITDNFTCNFGTVTAGSFITISIAYTVPDSISVPEVTNVVTATTTSNESNIVNNEAEDTNSVSGIVGALDLANDNYLVADFKGWDVSVAYTENVLHSSAPS